MSLQEVREQNIALVTQTALACFVENGIDKTTIRDIAHRAGLTERSVYRYFATKDELVVAAAFLYWDRAKAQAAQALVSARQPGMTGIEEIRVLLRSYAGLIFTDPAGIRFSLDAEVALCNAGRQHAVVNRPRRPSAAASPTGRSIPTPMSRCSITTPTTRSSASSSVCPSACRACTSSTGTRASTRCASSSRAHSQRRYREKKGQGIPFK
mgnify:CR=1 FL=1